MSNTENQTIRSGEEVYWPSLEEYNPGLTAEDYHDLLSNKEIIDPKWLDVLYYLFKMGGTATCKQIAMRFGGSYAHYNSNATSISQTIAEKKKIILLEREHGGSMYWPILFFGRDIKTDGEGVFEYRLRQPLSEAIAEMERREFSWIWNKRILIIHPSRSMTRGFQRKII